jgi:D-alanyl-D-alanine carboxypeptidase (penicillin-binding protein 5/6)
VKIVPKEDINILYEKSEGKKNVTYKVNVDKLHAPIKKGDIVGNIDLIENNKVTSSINLTVMEDIKKANILELYIRYLGDVIRGL